VFFPWSEISKLVTLWKFHDDPEYRDIASTVVQKTFFLAIVLFLIFQLRRLLEDMLLQQVIVLGTTHVLRQVEPEYSEAKISETVDIEVSAQPSQSPDIDEQFSEFEPRPLNSERVFKNFRGRMRSEYRRLKAISTRNLAIGIGFSFVALLFIAYPLVFAVNIQDQVSSSDQQTSAAINWLARYYVPRLAVGLLLQFVGFFFLRLYVANEQDIKHNSNEITNLEAKMMGLLVASERNDKSLFKSLIDNLAKTERNFVLKRREKTVLQDEDRKYNDLKDVLQTFVGTLSQPLRGRAKAQSK